MRLQEWLYINKKLDPLAQLAEHLTFNNVLGFWSENQGKSALYQGF